MELFEYTFGKEASIIRETNFQFLMLAAILPILGSALISPILQTLIEPIGATSFNIGLVISVFTAPSIFIIPFSGGLADRYRRKFVLMTSMMIFGISGTMIAFTNNFNTVLILRGLQGVGFAGISPVIITCIGDMYNGDTEATGQGIRFMISGLSGAVFPLLAGFLAVLAWQYPFLIYSISIPITLGVYLWFEEPTSRSSQGKDSTTGAIEYTRELRSLLLKRGMLAVMVARSWINLVWVGFVTYNSLIVAQIFGGTSFHAGIFIAIGYFTIAVTGSQAGRITSLFPDRLYPLYFGNLCLSSGFIIILFSPELIFSISGVIILGIGLGITGTLYRSLITSLSPEEFRGGLVSVAEAGGRMMATLTPLIMAGMISSLSPILEFENALKYTGLGIALLGGGGGLLCLTIYANSNIHSNYNIKIY